MILILFLLNYLQNRPFTRAVGNIKQLEREPTAVSPTPRPETAITAYEGDMLVYKGNCKFLYFIGGTLLCPCLSVHPSVTITK